MPDYSGIKVYLGVIRSYVSELKNFGLDFLVEGSAGCVSMSRVIVNKLPVEFRRVLIERTHNAFPLLNNSFRIITALTTGWH
jgi:hypothetical protein